MRNPDSTFFSRFTVEADTDFSGFDIFEDSIAFNRTEEEIPTREISVPEEDELFLE